jgi:precorrin-2 dehydrogenase/sirohydrochlorin ferrochelatase
VVNRGDLQIAISTNGRSPALAQRLRQELEAQFGPEYEAWVAELGAARDQLFATSGDTEIRRRLLHELASPQAFVSRNTKAERERSH